MALYERILIVLAVLNLGAMLFAIFKFFRDPDIKADKEIGISQVTCKFKHARIDEIFEEIKKQMEGIGYTFNHFKENEFNHIEENSKDININMATINGKMDIVVRLLTDVLNKK